MIALFLLIAGANMLYGARLFLAFPTEMRQINEKAARALCGTDGTYERMRPLVNIMLPISDRSVRLYGYLALAGGVATIAISVYRLVSG